MAGCDTIVHMVGWGGEVSGPGSGSSIATPARYWAVARSGTVSACHSRANSSQVGDSRPSETSEVASPVGVGVASFTVPCSCSARIATLMTCCSLT